MSQTTVPQFVTAYLHDPLMDRSVAVAGLLTNLCFPREDHVPGAR